MVPWVVSFVYLAQGADGTVELAHRMVVDSHPEDDCEQAVYLRTRAKIESLDEALTRYSLAGWLAQRADHSTKFEPRRRH